MQIFILGILVIAGCLAYIYVVNNKDLFVGKKNHNAHMYDETAPDEEEEKESSPVIYLPDDIEQEKEKRKKRR